MILRLKLLLLININKIVNHLNALGVASYDDKMKIVKKTWHIYFTKQH
jgi:hypothetical protein